MRLVTLFLLSLLLFTTSCGDDEDIQKEGNCLTAVVNGEDFTAESTTGVFNIINIEFENLGEQETRLLTITGTIPSLTGNTETITITFACSEFTSTLDVVDSDSDCGIGMNYQLTSFTDPNSSMVVTATSGTVNIEDDTNDRIRGTFTFTGDDQNGASFSITNGFFDTTVQ